MVQQNAGNVDVEKHAFSSWFLTEFEKLLNKRVRTIRGSMSSRKVSEFCVWNPIRSCLRSQGFNYKGQLC